MGVRAGNFLQTRQRLARKLARKLAGGISCFALAATGYVDVAAASAVKGDGFLSDIFTSTEIVLLAVFGGAMSFALMSASWLIRERTRINAENSDLRGRLADLRATHERVESLVNATDQRIVVWKGNDGAPILFGSLGAACGAPSNHQEFLSFGRWLNGESAISFEDALKRLRNSAEAFDLPLVTRKGGVMEAQGRTSGGHAFVRFIELSGERSLLAQLEADHARLMSSFDTIQKLFEAMESPVWLKDQAGQLYWTNTAYARAVDRENCEQVIHDGVRLLDSAERLEVGRKQRETGKFSGALPAIVSGDRKILDITEVATRSGNAGIAIDRSEVEAIRATLKQTIASHAQTLDHLATAIAMFDVHQKLQFYNSAFQKLWGLQPAFLDTQPTNAQVLDAIRAERKLPEMPDWRKWRETQLEIYRALEANEDWWYLPDGQTLRVVVNPHSHGGVTWVFENVTEQLALESNYNALMRVQGETLDHLSEAVAVFGSDGKLRLCNPAFANMFRLERKLIARGTHISQLSQAVKSRLADPASWEDIHEGVTACDDDRVDLKGRIETLDGAILDYSLVRLPDAQTMMTVSDMTAAVNIERALKERNEALEQSDHLKNQFIQHVSYELRAPLTSISGFSEMLGLDSIGALNEKQKEYVGHISSSAGTLKTIIDDILDLATIDAGAMTLDKSPCDLRSVIADSVDGLQERLAKHGIKVDMQIEPGAEQIVADPDRLAQILSNLLVNAVSFSPDGSTVTVTARRSAGMQEIAVSDEGPGVPKAERSRIFGRFESRSSANRRKGAGLGLSIVQSFVELHGGSVLVEDAERRGARFVCRFPIVRDTSRAAA
ncbi:MAG: PAS-domain containing protein [Nitratireductor sp.]|nr:PAS-domain containing protein [Nitratireductor sp.]MCB1455444.1 PAS-domain containing protein [Nitratireductor sp.]